MKLSLKFLMVFALLFGHLQDPLWALAPKRVVSMGPFEIPLDKYRVVELTHPTEETSLLRVEQKATGDHWFLRFSEYVSRLDVFDNSHYLPFPKEVGFDLRWIHNPEKRPQILWGLSSQEEQVSWISIKGKPERMNPYSWSVEIWKTQGLKRYGRSIYNGLFREGDPSAFKSLIGGRHLFQEKMKDQPFYEGDGHWGLFVKLRQTEQDLVLIYYTYPGDRGREDESIPLPDAIGMMKNGNLVTRRVTSFSESQSRIRFLDEELRTTDVKQPGKRRKLRRQSSRLRNLERKGIVSHTQNLYSLKRELVDVLGSFKGEARRHIPTKSPLDKLILSIDRAQKALAYSVVGRIQNEIFSMELDELRREVSGNGQAANFKKAPDYIVMGNETSPYPPVVVYPGWEKLEDNTLIQQLEQTKEGRRLLDQFKFLIIPLPGYERSRNRDDDKALVRLLKEGQNHYFDRAAHALDIVLHEEGEDRAFILGTGVGAVVAGEVAREYWQEAHDPNKRGEEPIRIEGIILMEPKLFNPVALYRGFFKGSLKRGLEVFKQVRIVTKFISQDLKGKASKLKWLTRWIKGDRQLRDHFLAYGVAYSALLSQSLSDTYARFEALKMGPTLVMARNSTEGRAIKQKIGDQNPRAKLAHYFPFSKEDDLAESEFPRPENLNMTQLFLSLHAIILDNEIGPPLDTDIGDRAPIRDKTAPVVVIEQRSFDLAI